jgi:hypothetical protein
VLACRGHAAPRAGTVHPHCASRQPRLQMAAMHPRRSETLLRLAAVHPCHLCTPRSRCLYELWFFLSRGSMEHRSRLFGLKG